MQQKVEFRLLGVEAAFLRRIGCPCKRCAEAKPRANTSAALLISNRETAKVEYVVLFDCGAGVVDSLIDSGLTHVNCVFNTHPHLDHILEADRLSNCLHRTSKSPLQWYCNEHAWTHGVAARFPWLPGDRGLVHHPLIHGSPVELGVGVGLRITPLDVYHGRSAPGSMIFVVEFQPAGGPSRKIVIAWDLLHLIPRYPLEDKDEAYRGPTVEHMDPLHEQLFASIDLLCLDINTWWRHPHTGHSSATAALSCHVPLVFKPVRTVFVHYSGHEDADGPMTDAEMRERLRQEVSATGWNLELGDHGQIFRFNG